MWQRLIYFTNIMLDIVQCLRYTRHFGSWMYFRLQVHLLYWHYEDTVSYNSACVCVCVDL
jgi:hypothetical protein